MPDVNLMTPLPRVAVLVLNWCGAVDSIACIESLRTSSYKRVSILVIDNGSPDESGALLHERFPDLKYVQTGRNLGYAGGNNAGFRAALAEGADYVLVLNNDTIVEADCIARLVETATITGAGVVSPRILYHAAPDMIWYDGGDFSPRRALGEHRRQGAAADVEVGSPTSISFATGCCFLVRADVVRDVGGFDEAYFAYLEDVEYSLRVARKGFKLLVDPRARVFHKIPFGRPDETPFQICQRDRNRRRLARTHLHFAQKVAFAAWFYATRAVHFGRYVVGADWPRARALLVGAFGSLDEGKAAPSDIRTRNFP